MLVKSLILLVTVPLITAQHGERCQESSDWSDPNFLPHPTNCSKYFSCASGIFAEMDCPARLHYNVNLKTCDWPASAGCSLKNGHRPLPVDDDALDGSSVAFPGDRCKPSEDRNSPRIAAHPTNCEQFLMCSGTWNPMKCPSGLLFSVESKHCEFPKNAKCCPTCVNTVKVCQTDGEKRQNLVDCHKYFICSNETFVEMYCDDGFVFNPIQHECVYGSSCNPIQNQPEPENLPNCSIENSLYPNHHDCQKFFICNGGTLVEQSCPPNKLFSVTHNNCQFKFFAVCAGEITMQ